MVRATAGEAFSVDLPSSPSTGYCWQEPSSEGDVRLLRQEYLAPADARPGSSGVQRFHLVAGTAGPLSLTFTLKRSWEAHGIDTRVVDVDVD